MHQVFGEHTCNFTNSKNVFFAYIKPMFSLKSTYENNKTKANVKMLEKGSLSLRGLLPPWSFLFPKSTGNICSWNSRFCSETLTQRIPSTHIYLKNTFLVPIKHRTTYGAGPAPGKSPRCSVTWFCFFPAVLLIDLGNQSLSISVLRFTDETKWSIATCPYFTWMGEMQIMEAVGIF